MINKYNSSKNIKKESLKLKLERAGSFNKSDFESALFNAISDVMFEFTDRDTDRPNQQDFNNFVKWFNNHFWEEKNYGKYDEDEIHEFDLGNGVTIEVVKTNRANMDDDYNVTYYENGRKLFDEYGTKDYIEYTYDIKLNF